MKDIYLHIGPPKTGSTTIQTMMDGLTPKLLTLGILYPAKGRPQFGESYLVQRSGGKYVETGPAISHSFLAWTLEGKIAGLSEEACWGPLIEEIETCNSHKVVISAEGFFHVSRASIMRIRERFANSNTKIIFFLREPFSYARSLYAQSVKVGKVHRSFSGFLKNYFCEAAPRQKTTLDNWSEVFGKQNVIVKPFEKLKRENNLEQDFLETIGAKELAVSGIANTVNNALPNHIIRELRVINYFYHFLGRPQFLQRTFQLIRAAVRSELFQRTIGQALRPLLQHSLYSESDRELLNDSIRDWYPKLIANYVPDEFKHIYQAEMAEVVS